MSGCSKKPDTDPTFSGENPTFGCGKGTNATPLLTILNSILAIRMDVKQPASS
jgi:hypothetical protein